MSNVSPAIVGANILGSRPFQFDFNNSAGASVPKTIDQGGYVLVATQDVWVTLGLTANSPVAAAMASSQPAASAPNATIRVPANTPWPLDVPAANMTIAALGVSSAGSLAVNGPMATSYIK